MIKKFIAKLLGKSAKVAKPDKAAAGAGTGADIDTGAAPAGKRVEVPKGEHGIDPKLVDERAVKVVSTLAAGGF